MALRGSCQAKRLRAIRQGVPVGRIKIERAALIERELTMAKNERRMPRKPATKFPNLRKKMLKDKIQSRQARKK